MQDFEIFSFKVTEFKTIITYFKYLQKLAADVNMLYVNITLDVGAAINAYKTMWSQPEMFRNIVIHLGDFHFMKENFLVSRFFYFIKTKNGTSYAVKAIRIFVIV